MHKIILICFCLFLFTDAALAQTKDNYEKFLDQAMSDFGGAAVKINNDYDLGKYRWDYTQDDGKLIFSDKGVPKVVATAQIVGSYSTYSNTWKWSWANDTVDDAVKKDISKVKDYGEKNQYQELTTAQWKCEEDYAWKMTAAAGQLIKAKGAYRGPIPDGYVYFLITDIKRVDAKK